MGLSSFTCSTTWSMLMEIEECNSRLPAGAHAKRLCALVALPRRRPATSPCV